MKSLPWLLVTLIACGSTQDLSTGTNQPVQKPGQGPKPNAAGDLSLDVDKVAVEGTMFEPEALGRPGMPLVDSKKPTTVAAERVAIQKAKSPVEKQAHAAILATLLYQDSKLNKAQEKQLWADARDALKVASGGVTSKTVDELTLRLIGSYELLLEDWPAAEQAWAALVAADPKNPEVDFNRAWWAYALLKQGKNAEALAAAQCKPDPKTCPQTPVLATKQPELAYATAWAKWRTGDSPGALQAMLIAAEGWGSNAGADAVQLEALLFASRSDMPFATAEPQLFKALSVTDPARKYEVLARLGLLGYRFAGRWADAVAAIDKAIAYAGNVIPANDLPLLRGQQAEYAIALDQPDVAAKYSKQALQAVTACGAKCKPAEQQELIKRVATTARLFHILYATANDVRFYQPANDLYIATIPMITDAAYRTEVNNGATVLQQTLKNMKAGTGSHERGAVGALLGRHAQEVQACYEGALVSDAKIGGQLVVNLDFDPSGAARGVATEPKAGQAGVAAVAGCVERHAKAWKLPKRGMPGSTRVKMSFDMAPKKKAPAAAAAAPAPATGAAPAPAPAPAPASGAAPASTPKPAAPASATK